MLHKMMTRTWLSIAGDSDEFECEDCGERIYESEAEECETCGRGDDEIHRAWSDGNGG